MDEQAVAMFLVAVGDQLGQARRSQSLTVDDVAYRCGVPRTVVEQAEAGRDVGLQTVARICVAIGVRLGTVTYPAEAAVLAQGSAPWFDQPTDIIDLGTTKRPPPTPAR